MIKFSLFLTLIIQYSLSYGAQSHSDVVYGEDNREEISLYHGQLWSDVSKSIALQVNKENINFKNSTITGKSLIQSKVKIAYRSALDQSQMNECGLMRINNYRE